MDTKEARWACMLTRALYINLEQIIIKIKLVPIGLLPLALLCKEFEVEERQRPLGALGHRSTLRAESNKYTLGLSQRLSVCTERNFLLCEIHFLCQMQFY